MSRFACLFLLAACGDVTDAAPDAVTPDAPSPDGGAMRRCDPAAPFGAPVLVMELSAEPNDFIARLSPDELTLYLTREDVLVSTRASRTAAWSEPVPLAAVNTANTEFGATVTADGKTLFVASDRPGAAGLDPWVATRPDAAAEFSAPQLVANVNTADDEFDPFVSSDGSTLYWWVRSSDGFDIFRATRGGAGFSAPSLVAELQSDGNDSHLVVTSDGLTAMFGSSRPGGAGGRDVYRTTRPSLADPFSPPVYVAEVSSEADDQPTWLADDGCVLYLSSDRGGTYDIYVATRPE